MLFQERKKEKGYTYDVEDVFGKIHIASDEKLDGDTLDGIVSVLMRQNVRAETVKGTVKLKKGEIKYKFIKAPMWSEDDEKESCKNTHTSTQEPVIAFSLIRRLPKKIINWLRRFAVAFREAWSRSK